MRGALASGAIAVAFVGCTSDDSSDLGSTIPAATHDASVADAAQLDAAPSTEDANTGDDSTGDDAAEDASDASDANAASDVATDAADAAPLPFCATQVGLAFCADFDAPAALDAGLAGWDEVVSRPGELTTSAARATSAPDSLSVLFTPGPAGPNSSRSAKVVKTITPPGQVGSAIYEFDLYIDALPNQNTGAFVDDFQFATGDQYGFRIALFPAAADGGTSGTLDHAEFQHNHQVLGGPDDIKTLPLTMGKWTHVKTVVAFDAGDGGDAGATASVQVYLDKSATPTVDEVYPAPSARAPFARIVGGIPFAFNDATTPYGLYYDNVTLKLQ